MPKILSVAALLFLAGLPLTLPNKSGFQFENQFPFDPTRITEEISSETQAFFQNTRLNAPPLAQIDSNPTVLGDTTAIKRIQVDLTNQRLYAFEGEKMVYNFLISSGKYDRTPTGKFRVWTKIKSQKMSGGSRENGTYYYLPNVPYIMFFSNDKVAKKVGYSLHGTYWHSNFGVPMSHGCINMKTAEAQQIYYWINPVLPDGKTSTLATQDNPGTEITIYGKYNPKVSSKKAPSKTSVN